LKDSGNIEEDADTILIAVQDTTEEAVKIANANGINPQNIINLGVVKNREGGTGLHTLYFDKEIQKIMAMQDYLERGTEAVYGDDEPYFIENTYTEDDELF